MITYAEMRSLKGETIMAKGSVRKKGKKWLVLRQEKVQVKRELFFGTILTFPFLLISHGSVVL